MRRSINILFASFMLIIGCNFNSTYLNEQSEKEDAEKVIERFRQIVIEKKFNNTKILFSNEFG